MRVSRSIAVRTVVAAAVTLAVGAIGGSTAFASGHGPSIREVAKLHPYTSVQTAPGTYYSGAAANISGGIDGQTSMCVNPDPFVVNPPDEEPKPGGGTSITWPTTIDQVNPSVDCQQTGANSVTFPADAYDEGIPGSPWLTIAGSHWVGTDPNHGLSDSTSQAPSLTDYDFEFSVPACTNYQVQVVALADNEVGLYLNDVYQDGQLNANTTLNFHVGGNNPATFTTLVSGGSSGSANVIDFLVQDDSTSKTGLDYMVKITNAGYAAADGCNGKPGTLKICKIGGPHVAGSATFSVVASAVSYPTTVSVAAGPASQGGYCKILPKTIPAGVTTTITETPPGGTQPTAISVNPIGSGNTVSGTAIVNIQPGMNVVTFTNTLKQKSGYVEICKVYAGTPPNNAPFHFTVKDGGGITTNVVVPAGDCTGPINVLYGHLTITETGFTGTIKSATGNYSLTGAPATVSRSGLVVSTFMGTTATAVSNDLVITITDAP